MKNKFLIVMLGAMMSFMLTTVALAEDVYVTQFGKKYHKENSRFIKDRDVEKLSKEEAEERGYEPSSEFLKDEAQTDNIKTNKK